VNEFSIVVDLFLGSGTFAIPAIKLNRYFFGIENDKQTFENAKNNVIKETTTTSTASTNDEKQNTSSKNKKGEQVNE
jgi:DNA modification methylase